MSKAVESKIENSFLQKSRHLYETMLVDMDYCRKKELGMQKEIECCFMIAEKYWSLLQEEVAKHEFKTAADEIIFFKTIKPLFTSEMEYYTLRYHAQLFKESMHDADMLKKFWLRESLRLERFYLENQEVYEYFKSGCTEMVEKFFTRANNDMSNALHANAYDVDCQVATSHDYMVARLAALERYQEYINDEIRMIDDAK